MLSLQASLPLNKPSFTLGLLISFALLSACSSPAQQRNKDGSLAEDDDPTALLDDPVNLPKSRKATVKAQDDASYMLPQAGQKPGMPIDGKFEGWDAKSLKTFTDKSLVELGPQFWSGPDDLSMRVGLKSDDSFVYLWLEVKDDVVIEQDDERGNPVDAVVVWLRDPKLESMFSSLPDGVSVDRDIVTEIALAFSPSGRVRLLESQGQELPDGVVWSESFKTPTGYGVEVALRAEVFPFVASMPLAQMAFRVEALDGDEPKRLGVQSRMSMLPRKGAEAPRFALTDLGGMLPSWPVDGVPGRADGLGLWRRKADKKSWAYTSYEVLPKHWVYMDELSGLEQQLKKQDIFQKVCNKARFDASMLEAYRSISDKHRAGLFLCSARKLNGRCPDQAQSRLFWVHMARKDDLWELKQSVEVFSEPMSQCADAPVDGELFRRSFATFPLDFAGSMIWAIGWKEEQRASGYYAQADKVAILNLARKEQQLVGEVSPQQITAEEDTRSLSEVKIYFVELDDEPGFDICEIERVQEQTCRSLNAQCQTRANGTSTLTHVKTWSPAKGAFEPYLLSKHPLCTHDFSLDKQAGYMLMHLGNRIGLLPSAKE